MKNSYVVLHTFLDPWRNLIVREDFGTITVWTELRIRGVDSAAAVFLTAILRTIKYTFEAKRKTN